MFINNTFYFYAQKYLQHTLKATHTYTRMKIMKKKKEEEKNERRIKNISKFRSKAQVMPSTSTEG